MSHFDEVLDMGYDYGADGGPGWETDVIAYPNGRTRRNQLRSNALGRWQLGNRDIASAELASLQNFFHAMRGQLHTFLYHDWNDYIATNEAVTITGASTSQLVKTYGSSINPWSRDITKPNAETVVIEYNTGSSWVVLEADTDYTLDASTGIVTWLLGPLPNAPDLMRWSGQFWVRARFDRDTLTAQFIGAEDRTDGQERAYSIGALSVVEEPETA